MPRTDAWSETTIRKILSREAWMASAACVGHPSSDFFVESKGSWDVYENKSRPTCSSCPVWKDCLKYALDNHEGFGVWGGLVVTERRKVRHIDDVYKCSNCKLIGLFTQKAQKVCDRCLHINSRKRKRRG